MSNEKKAIEDIHTLAKLHGLNVVALVLEDEESAFVSASSIKDLLLAQKLVNISLENIPEELMEEECECPECKPQELKFFELMQNSFPNLLATMPEEIKEEFINKFSDKSDKEQEYLFEKSFSVLHMMSKLLG